MFPKVMQAMFGAATGGEQRRLVSAFMSLLDAGVEEFTVLDDRGGSGTWNLRIPEEIFLKLDKKVQRKLNKRLQLTTEDA